MRNNTMERLFGLTGILAIGLIFWAALGFLMELPSFRTALPLSVSGIIVFLLTGFLKNRAEKQKFREFLDTRKADREVQQKIQDKKTGTGHKTGRSLVKAEYRERNTGLNWTGASVHGAVPHRKKRRSFLPKNR